MVSYRFLTANTVKLIGLLCASLCAWYLGYFFAEIMPEDYLQTAIGSMQQIGKKPVIKAPLPLKQKCSVWRKCQPYEFVFCIRSGGGKSIPPNICVEDEIVIGKSKNNGERGFNFAIINPDTLKVTDTKSFDMYDGDFSGPMVEFMNKIPNGFIIMVASHDEASSKLSEEGKKAFEALGSKEIRNLRFRSGFVFLAVKGATLPAHIEREKIIHSDSSRNRFSGWPSIIQIDGCMPKK